MVTQTLETGYKQTELGVIPEDWDIKKFTECADLKHGFQFREEHFSKDGIIIVKIGNLIDGGGINLSNVSFIPLNSLVKFSGYALKKGDVLMALTGATLGKVSIVDTNKTTLQNYRVGKFVNKKNINNAYIYYLLQSSYIQKKIKSLVNEAAQPNIGKADFDKFLVPISKNKEEQAAIAEVLSETDALIKALDRLIEKKKNIKQGAMQELLTGKSRLHGEWINSSSLISTEIGIIPKDWVIKKIGETLRVRHGKSQHEIASDNGIYPILATGGEIGRTDDYLYDKPSVLIGRKGTIDKPQYITTPFWTVDTLFYTEVFDDFYPKFLFYKFNTIDWYSYNEASGVPSLNATTIEGIQVSVPSTFDEQKAIAQVLSDIDSEIEGLEEERKKYIQLKIGMMQQLLTGEIRLKWNS